MTQDQFNKAIEYDKQLRDIDFRQRSLNEFEAYFKSAKTTYLKFDAQDLPNLKSTDSVGIGFGKDEQKYVIEKLNEYYKSKREGIKRKIRNL